MFTVYTRNKIQNFTIVFPKTISHFHYFLTFFNIIYKWSKTSNCFTSICETSIFLETSKRQASCVIKSKVIGNGKIVWKYMPYCWYFCLNLKYLESPYRAYIKTTKNGSFCEALLNEKYFEALLDIFCCYNHGDNTSEAVQKIDTDQKAYHKCSLCVIICWIAKMYLSINNSEKRLVREPPT